VEIRIGIRSFPMPLGAILSPFVERRGEFTRARRYAERDILLVRLMGASKTLERAIADAQT